MRNTGSVCPICLARVPARRVRRNKNWYLEKICPIHGEFSTVVWRGSENIRAWVGDSPENGAEEGLPCPDGCGLCEKHLRGTCCTLLEVTDRCNLHCRFCFADPASGSDLPLDTLKAQIDEIVRQTGGTLLQLSGGEPTVRDDLAELIAYARAAGCDYVQLNTNGLRLAADPSYARTLALAGLSFVFLQFDGVTDALYEALRGLHGDYIVLPDGTLEVLSDRGRREGGGCCNEKRTPRSRTAPSLQRAGCAVRRNDQRQIFTAWRDFCSAKSRMVFRLRRWRFRMPETSILSGCASAACMCFATGSASRFARRI